MYRGGFGWVPDETITLKQYSIYHLRIRVDGFLSKYFPANYPAFNCVINMNHFEYFILF